MFEAMSGFAIQHSWETAVIVVVTVICGTLIMFRIIDFFDDPFGRD